MLITMFWLTSFLPNKSEDTQDKMTPLMKAVHKHLSFRVLALYNISFLLTQEHYSVNEKRLNEEV